MPRENNKVADGLADLTMDRWISWETQFETSLDVRHAKILVQTDGGVRDKSTATASWIIGLWGRGQDGERWRYEPLVAHGTFPNSAITVFTAEAIALDEASEWVQGLIRRCDCE